MNVIDAVAACLILHVLGCAMFWTAFVSIPALRLSASPSYLDFELAFPPADVCLCFVSLLAGGGIVAGGSWAPICAAAAGGAMVFLGALDLAYVARGRLYDRVRPGVLAHLAASGGSVVLGTAVVLLLIIGGR